MGRMHADLRLHLRLLCPRVRSLRIDQGRPATDLPPVSRGDAAPQDRRGGRDPVQGVRLLSDRLSERFVQGEGQGRQAPRILDLGRWIDGAYAIPGEEAPQGDEEEDLSADERR